MTQTWTKEKCLEKAQKCKTKYEFRKNFPQAYSAACRNKWLSDYTFLKSEVKSFKRHPSNYWTKERCAEESKKYECRKEFFDNSNTAYVKSLHMGWLNEFTWLNDRLNNISKRTGNHNSVYAYIFEEQKAVYVGRTNNTVRRDREHLFSSESYDTIARFCKIYDLMMPEMTILEVNLTLNESCDKEKFYIDKYRNAGYQIINRARCGNGSSSIGKIGIFKWTYETCYSEAKKFKYAKDFQKSRSAYNSARKHNWLKDYTWLEFSRRDNYWNKETCEQEAKRYSSRNEFRINAGTAYRYAMNNGWINDYTWLKRPTVWNKGKNKVN